MTGPIADANQAVTLFVFGVILTSTLIITFWAARRTRNRHDFWAAGGRLSASQNGLAIAGDVISAATFLGFVGLIFLAGLDGFVLPVAVLAGFLLLQVLLADRLRNTGRFTATDVVFARLGTRSARAAMATTTLVISTVYLVAQLVGGGVLISALTGVTFPVAVLTASAFMLTYVLFGGMLATSWVQIIKAVLLITAGIAVFVAVLAQTGFNAIEIFDRAKENSGHGDAYLGSGNILAHPLDAISTTLAFCFGIAGLPHVLMRFFTVPDSRTARRSLSVATLLIGAFVAMVSIIGYGARALLDKEAQAAVGAGGNLATPLLAQALGGGPGTLGGDLFLAAVAAVAFATILAVVAGLLISAASSVAHDVYAGMIRKDHASDTEEVRMARITAVVIGAVAITITLAAGSDFNVAFLVGLALAVAASTTFPVLLLCLTWRRFTATGAVCGIAAGLISSVSLIVLSPSVWGADAPVSLTNPAVISMPFGFLGCYLGSVLGRRRASKDRFAQFSVMAETGLIIDAP